MVAAVVGIGELSFYRTRDGLPDGRPWVEGIATDYDHHQGPATLARMLQAACYVVIPSFSRGGVTPRPAGCGGCCAGCCRVPPHTEDLS